MKRTYTVDAFGEVYSSLQELRRHIESLTPRDALDYDGCVVLLNGKPARLIDLVHPLHPSYGVVFRKLKPWEIDGYVVRNL